MEVVTVGGRNVPTGVGLGQGGGGTLGAGTPLRAQRKKSQGLVGTFTALGSDYETSHSLNNYNSLERSRGERWKREICSVEGGEDKGLNTGGYKYQVRNTLYAKG